MRRRATKNQGLAAPELSAIEVGGMTREAFLTRATLAAGAVYGLGAIAPFVSRAFAQAAVGDIDILNFALTLEKLEATFYKEASKKVSLDPDAKALTEELATNESEHVSAITTVVKSLGGKPVAQPPVNFHNAFSNQGAYLELAQTFEDTGVAAYNGSGPNIKSTQVLQAAGTIVQVEGRHASLIRMMRGESFAPKAFDDMLSIPQVRTRVTPYVSG